MEYHSVGALDLHFQLSYVKHTLTQINEFKKI